MKNILISTLLCMLVSFSTPFSGVEWDLRQIKRDLGKVYKEDGIELIAIDVPDSLYNNLLLDNGRIYSINSGARVSGYVYIGRIYSCRAGGCSADIDDTQAAMNSNDEDFEYFDYYTIFGPELQVLKVKVFNYQATHGQAICSTGWLSQFKGYDGREKLEYGKEIDALSGATISANAITYGIQESARYLKLIEPVLSSEEQQAHRGIIK